MMTVLVPAGQDCRVEARLRSLGVALRFFSSGEGVELDSDSVDQVVMVPETVMDTASWRKMRVDLARGNRLFVALVGNVSTKGIVNCMRDGAHDVLAEEDDDADWLEVLRRTVEHQRLWVQLYGGRPLSAQDVLIGRSEAIQHLRLSIDRIGPTDASVLLLGESGVGKEKVASALHMAGRRGPFVTLNCAAIPRDLLESELFGVERGAFTGATKSRPGLVEQANEGTLFLDEIGELDLAVQPKLLRFLETHRARRVGGQHEYSVKVRIISATNRNLDQQITEAKFRSDLYYRLGEIILQIAPLRSRSEDLPELARWFLRLSNQRFGKNFQQLEPDLIRRLQQYAWPGNVRELKSAIDRLVIFFDGPVLRSSWWEPPVSSGSASRVAAEGLGGAALGAGPQPVSAPNPGPGFGRPGPRRDAAIKQGEARRLLAESGGAYAWVAAQLGVHPSTLFRWRRGGKI